MIEFTKLSGNGNDFIAIDNRAGILSERKIPQFAREHCRRHYSLGADGLLLLENLQEHFMMRYFNKDGSEGELCGNGARCFARYLNTMELIGNSTEFNTRAGKVYAYLKDGMVGIRLGDISRDRIQLNQQLELHHVQHYYSFLEVGVPHCVLFSNGEYLKHYEERNKIGREIRYRTDIFPEGVNVNFVILKGPHTIDVQTYERGVEEITQACGTGVVASTLITHLLKGMEPPIEAITQGGKLITLFKSNGNKFFDIYQEGEVKLIARGTLY